jgi:uncharacterized protein (TIGR03085 family)
MGPTYDRPMTSMARSEREQLCDLALQVGEAEPTLCEGWDVKDLMVHLVLREGSPASVANVVPQLSGVLERASRRLAARDFTVLVERVRRGPPVYSPFALPKVDEVANTLEYFVHHEDVRRARPDWEPRVLSARDEDRLWRMVALAGRGLVRGSRVGVTLQRSDDGSTKVLSRGLGPVVVQGLPSEIVLFLFGRKQHARVELLGDKEHVCALRGTSLGV